MQQHDARRLHFNFRIELDGVLKSWAVTLGPSLNPSDKRLAVRTDDCPLDQLPSESMPAEKGHDATTATVLWDSGVWHPKSDAREGLERGLLRFDLDGERLKGGFALVRLGAKARETRENWLLIKQQDNYAERDSNAVELWNRSIASDENPTEPLAPAPSSGRAPAKRGRRAVRRPRTRLMAAEDDKEPD